MIIQKILWLLLEILLWCFFLWFGSTGALMLAVMLVLLPLACLCANLLLRGRLRLKLEAPVTQRKDDPTLVTVRLRNPTFLPVVRLRCTLRVHNQLNRESSTHVFGTCLLPRGFSRNRIRISSRYCGRLRLSVEDPVLYDCFGLIGIPCRCSAVAYTAVQPDTFEPVVSMILNPSSADDSDSYSDSRPGADLSETYQIREYVPGDSPRQIHWKLTNKFDKIIVRDPSLPISRNVLVFWERTGESTDPTLIDAQAEVVVSLCRSLMDSGWGFTLGWNDTDRNLCILHELQSMDDLVAVIPRLLRATGAADAVSGAALLTQTRPDALCAHMIYIGCNAQNEVADMQRWGHVTMLLCGETAPEGAVLFDPWDYPKQLAQIEV